ncbi:tyrosine-type recombinase/integrase [Roseomonas stagni]|uniref:Tyrosine-type recombinase/integrase n=1 Tax=Falsiroseomonas algicola TaxID=2716930 RepID=A0A6M1LVF1_9PROT|nr:tyrosine-type recombinase/integrase [Falsiroseomonas algicola]NGM23983.1 tyrosine-type recombinase/integrase [Falsiroseomonas algicola]
MAADDDKRGLALTAEAAELTPGGSVAPAVAERLEAHAHAARGAFAPETERALRKASAAFTAWAAEAGVPALPCPPTAVAAYVDALAARPLKPASIRQAVWAIGALHRAAGLDDPVRAEAVRLALKRMARALGTRQRQAAPIGEDDVRLLLRVVGAEPAIRLQRDVALLLVMRDLLARRAEAVALDVEDIAPAADGSATALIRRSKTDQEGGGAMLWLSPRAAAHLRRWTTLAGVTEGAIFRRLSKAGRPGGRLAPSAVPTILKGLAALAALDPAAFSGHSARVGMTQDLAASGSELPAIMQAGRWKSPAMPARYAERALAGRGAVARFYARRDG